MVTIRCSTLPGYPDCPRRSACKLIRDQIQEAGYELRQLPAGIGAAVGTGSHWAADWVIGEFMSGKIEVTPEGDVVNPSPLFNTCKEIGIQKFRDEIADGVIYDGTTSSTRDAERQIDILTRSFLTEVLPMVKPLGTEIQRRAQLNDSFELSGRLDCEEQSGIYDWKYGSKLSIYDSQQGGYSLLRQSIGLTKPDFLRVYHMPRTSVKKQYPGARQINISVNSAERAAYAVTHHIMRDIRNWWASRDPWSFTANPMSMLCSDKYCEAWGTSFCEFGRK